MKNVLKHVLTGLVVAIAVTLALHRYWDYVVNPWTRDGQVRADVILIAPRVSGPIVKLPIRDNQRVNAGDLLFEIDPRTFQAGLDLAKAQLDQTGGDVTALEREAQAAKAQVDVSRSAVEQAKSEVAAAAADLVKVKADYDRSERLVQSGAISQLLADHAKAKYDETVAKKASADEGLVKARASLASSQAALAKVQAKLVSLGADNPQRRSALARLRQAELKLDFTKVRAPVDGYVTNLDLRLGSQAVANQPTLALVDVSSYWISGFFQETDIARIRRGNRAIVTLMSYPDSPIEGHVDSIGWGIAQKDGSTGSQLLPNVSPTFEWIRLAQRVPVRIHLSDVPKNIELRVGTTCSVLVMTGTSRSGKVPPVPAALQ